MIDDDGLIVRALYGSFPASGGGMVIYDEEATLTGVPEVAADGTKTIGLIACRLWRGAEGDYESYEVSVECDKPTDGLR